MPRRVKNPFIRRERRLKKPPHFVEPFVFGGSLPLPKVLDFGRPNDLPHVQDSQVDPILNLASAEAEFHAMQVNSGWEILNRERNIESAADIANVWAAQGFNNPSPFEPTRFSPTPDSYAEAMQQQAPPVPQPTQGQPPHEEGQPLPPHPFGPPMGG
jgi:hypothetical protein